ncbi:MAG: hypothetical protein RI968_928 [Pseudomonadota bacterium]
MAQPKEGLESDGHWMALALEQARLAAAEGEVPVGAVLVMNGELLATGRNGPISDADPTAHAEMKAIRSAARQLGNYRLPGGTLYVTLEPCLMCAGAIFHSRLSRVVFAAPDPKTGAAGSVTDAFSIATINHHCRVEGGLMAEESATLLQNGRGICSTSPGLLPPASVGHRALGAGSDGRLEAR